MRQLWELTLYGLKYQLAFCIQHLKFVSNSFYYAQLPCNNIYKLGGGKKKKTIAIPTDGMDDKINQMVSSYA